MKTNEEIEILNILGYEAYRRISDGYFNATQMMNELDIKLDPKRKIADYIHDKQTKEFVKIVEDRNDIPEAAELSKDGCDGQTWMHPLLFLNFCFWLSPKMEYNLLKGCFSGMTNKEFEGFMNYFFI